jgi:hypothetical protein
MIPALVQRDTVLPPHIIYLGASSRAYRIVRIVGRVEKDMADLFVYIYTLGKQPKTNASAYHMQARTNG